MYDWSPPDPVFIAFALPVCDITPHLMSVVPNGMESAVCRPPSLRPLPCMEYVIKILTDQREDPLPLVSGKSLPPPHHLGGKLPPTFGWLFLGWVARLAIAG